MSLEGLFPNAGSYTGTTRNPLIGRTTSNVDDCQKANDLTVSVSRAPTKMDPINVAKSLLTDEVLSQIFITQQNANSITTEYGDSTNDDAVTQENDDAVMQNGVASSQSPADEQNTLVSTDSNEIMAAEYPITTNNFSNSVTEAYAEIENMESPKLGSNVFLAA
ncbi:MAG: hypothetical protein V4544_04540 [Pseudomonadota bacterium]